MNALHALILGIVQGLTEFMPISSSAHLVIFPKILNWPYWGKTFDVALHLGTFLALVAYYRWEVWNLLKAFFLSILERRLGRDGRRKMAWLIFVSTIPAVVAGVFLDSFIEEKCSGMGMIAFLLIAFSFLLWQADRRGAKERTLEDLDLRDAFIVGVAQALALFPGVSRSGITMTAGLFLGMKRAVSAEFCFLISLPVIGGAALFKGIKLVGGGVPAGMILPMLLGVLSSATTGYLCIRFLLRYLSGKGFLPFVVYRFLLGGFLLAWLLLR